MKISVVIAAYNEAQNIGPLTERLILTLQSLPDAATWELIYVIEGTDGTRAIAEDFARRHSQIRILYNEEPSGLANAFRLGFAAIAPDTDLVVTMDADLNHQPEQIPQLVNALLSRNADIVVGSRKVEGSASAGTPIWKRTLSDAGNRYMRAFIGMPVADMTSGYRVYRFQALKEIAFSSKGFAFLPEILMQAHAAGHQIMEEPIQFIFRVAGESKMKLLPTALSYTGLFCKKSLSLPVIVAALILLAALGIRLLVAFPVHKYQADADGILAGLCGIKVLQGNHPVFFPGGYRLGAQSCYVTAAAFSLFGVSRESLALTGLLFSFFFVAFIYLYLREAFGPRASLAGLLMAAAPPLQLLINTYVAWAYGEILMYCASSLWLATVLERRKVRAPWFFAFGLSSGLALWCSIQSLMITAPIFLWLLLRRVLNSASKASWVIVGTLVGSSPLSIFLAQGGMHKVFGDTAMHTAATLAQVVSNVSYLFSTQLPSLLAESAPPVSLLSQAGLALTIYAVAISFLICLCIWPNSPVRRQPALSSQAMLLSLILLCCSGLYAFSAAGSIRGWAVRYILPVYLVVPGLFCLLCSVLKKKWLVMIPAATAIGFLLFMNLREYPFTSTPYRKSLEASLKDDEQLIELLRQKQIQAVVGDYWEVYGLNFDSQGTVVGIPVEKEFDYLAFERKLGCRKIKWAILDTTPRHLVAWQRRLNSPGDMRQMGPDHFIWIPEIKPSLACGKGFLELARATNPN